MTDVGGSQFPRPRMQEIGRSADEGFYTGTVSISRCRQFTYSLPLPITEEDAEAIGEHVKALVIDAIEASS